MNRSRKTWPFEEGWPDRPDCFAEGSIADAEWLRICQSLASCRLLSPAWGSMIFLAADTFDFLHRLEADMTRLGRTEGLAEAHANGLALYREMCRDLLVNPHPSATVRLVNERSVKMPGRRPKPVNLKMLQGTHRPDRSPVRTNEAAFQAGAPEKPGWLDKEAAAHWDKLIRELADESGILSPGFFGIVTTACVYFSQYRRAQTFIEENGEVYETLTEAGSKMIREFPQVRQRDTALAGYRKCLNDLGCTPTQAPRAQRLPDINQTELELPGISKMLG